MSGPGKTVWQFTGEERVDALLRRNSRGLELILLDADGPGEICPGDIVIAHIGELSIIDRRTPREQMREDDPHAVVDPFLIPPSGV